MELPPKVEMAPTMELPPKVEMAPTMQMAPVGASLLATVGSKLPPTNCSGVGASLLATLQPPRSANPRVSTMNRLSNAAANGITARNMRACSAPATGSLWAAE